MLLLLLCCAGQWPPGSCRLHEVIGRDFTRGGMADGFQRVTGGQPDLAVDCTADRRGRQICTSGELARFLIALRQVLLERLHGEKFALQTTFLSIKFSFDATIV